MRTKDKLYTGRKRKGAFLVSIYDLATNEKISDKPKELWMILRKPL